MPKEYRPRILDLFCGAGGAAVGYHRAGFDVVGVDIRRQPRYPFEFIQADALTFLDTLTWLEILQFSAIHASPPCQAYTAGANIWLSRLGPATDRHPDLIGETRDRLLEIGLPYVIENVPNAAPFMRDPYVICGLSLGLEVKRHRLFETDVALLVPPCHSKHAGDWISVFGGGGLSRTPKGGQARVNGRHNGRGAHDGRIHIAHGRASRAMGIDWMTRDELSEAIPPAYTEIVGHQLRREVDTRFGIASVSSRFGSPSRF